MTEHTTLAELDRAIEVIDAKQSDANASAEQDEIELQIYQERRSQLESMLSNLVKAAAETSDAIISNIK